MSGSIEVLMRAILLLLTPTMLVLPVILAWCIPNQTELSSHRALARTKMAALVIMTGLALCVWIVFLIIGTQLPAQNPFSRFAHFTSFLFFPLWFGLAMPAIRAKNPNWGGAFPGTDSVSDTIRTASLVNRERENPIKPWYWIVAGLLTFGCLIAIAARGLFLASDPESLSPTRNDWMQWILATVIYASCMLINWITLPMAMRASHAEPEPLDARGSEELIELYRLHRQQKVRGLFWLVGVATPTFIGLMIACLVWWPQGSRFVGLFGGIGGSIIGTMGAIFGVAMGIQRARIAEVKTQLDATLNEATSN